MDPVAAGALLLMGQPSESESGPNGHFQFSGVIPANGHVVLGGDGLGSFVPSGGFINIPHLPGPANAAFDLYVDNIPVASKVLTYNIQ